MEKLLLSLSNYLRDFKKIYFTVLFLMPLCGLAQSITTNKTVTANATNCGIVNVKVAITGANPITRNSDVILAIDVSGSMGNTISGDFKTSMDYAKDAAKAFLTQAKANPQNRIAIVAYSTTASLKIGLTYLNAAGVTLITNQINALQATNSTNIYAGIVKAETELETNGRFDCSTARAIILLTDGVTNVTGTNGNTNCSVSKTSQCVTDAINAATNAKTTTKSSVVYNNQVFSVGLFGGISGNINTNNSDQNIAKFTLDGIQGSPASITQSGANLTAIYNQIATQISWIAQNLITKETVIPGFTIASITTSKGTTSLSGQVITWNTDFLNSETITLNYQLTPTGTACGTQTVSTSTLNYQNSACANDSKAISSPSYFVPCAPVITGVLTACGSTTLTATTNAASPAYVWYKDGNVISGETAATLLVTVSGAYKVKVKNGVTNCELTSAESTVSISPAAALTAPANANISGCGTSAITGLLYSTASTTITLAQLTTAGGILPNNASIGNYTISYSDVASGTCPTIVTRTFKVATSCGNSTSAQIITITDTTAPTWITPVSSLNKTIECSDALGLTSAQALFPVASDLCDSDVSNIVKVSGVFVASADCSNSGTYTNTWTVKDDCGNTSETFTQVITIQDTSAPTWSTPVSSLNKTIECSDALALTSAQALFPAAVDLCDNDVSNIVKVSGVFVASADCANAGTYTNKWTVKDDCGNISDAFTQVISIEDTTAPTWSTQIASLNKTIECSDALALTSAQALFPVALDLCDNDVSNIVKVSGVFVASADCANAGTYTNTWTVKDDCGNTSETFTQVITIQDTTAPTWSTPVSSLNKTIECSDALALTSAQALFPVALDLCDSDVSNIVKVSGVFVASADCSNSGTYTNTWTVKDDCGNTSETFTQIITIQDTSAPTWSTPISSLNKTIECSDALALTSAQALFPVASDLCDNDVSNIVKISGVFVASADCSNSGTYTNTWTVKDDCGNTSDNFTQVISIEDTTAPTWITQIASLNKTIECSDALALTSAQALFHVALDLCDSDVSNIVKVSGGFIASADCSNSGTYTNKWTVKDDCGNTSETFTQIIALEDTTKPIFIGDLPSDSTVSCDAVPEPANVEALDNCNGNLPIVFSEIKSNIVNECATNYTLTRTWKTSDCGRNTASYTQIITVRDTTPPTGTAPADVTNLQTVADIPVGNVTDIINPADNCSATVNITVSDANNGGTGCEGNAYILTRTYILTDCAGNKTELKQTFTVENKVSVTGIATNATCFGGKDGSILVTNSPGSTVVITNENNEVVGNSNLSAGTYTLTATSAVNSGNQTCSAIVTVVITQPIYTVKISGQIINKDTNTPIANVPVTLVPQGATTGPVLLRITGADGFYTFSGMVAGSYLVQVQDANLNSAHQLYPVDSSLFFTTLEDCKIQQHNFEYGASTLPVLGDYVWYDTNSNGIQDEWYDANNDGIVTKNIPDGNGAVDYSQWEWIDLNGDGSYKGTLNVGELNAGGFGNSLSPNVIIDGPNGYHQEVIVGIEGFWRTRPNAVNPYGDYTIKLVKDANLNAVASALGNTGLVKVLPSITDKKATNKTSKSQLHTVCSTTGGASGYIVTITPEDLVHLNADFGVNCKVFADIVANDDSAGPIASVNHITENVLNVLNNDTLEGVVVKASDVIITTVTPNEFLQLNPDGSVAILPNAPVGTLTLVYQICEADQTSNCDTATVTVIISASIPAIIANDDTYNNIGCNTFGLVGNVLSNDFKGLTKASLDLVNFTLLSSNIGTKTDPNITFDILGNATVSALTPAGTYTYSYQICDKLNADNCDTATVTIIVVPNAVTNISSTACNDDSTLIDLLALLPENTPTTGIWIDPNNSNTIQGNTFNALGLALGNYTFEYKITNQICPRSILLTMIINNDCKVLACGNVIVHNAFSPNGDGINDVFKIDSIDDITCYPENDVEIYNRWGILVFETENYNNITNVFDGVSRGRTTVKQSDGLPTGTYFYIINYKSLDGNNVLQNNKKDGYLYLSK
ncbi:gliding motility-associated C-terminal domain-containing protein [Flavobacterium psychroterrae]|uniref:Gliding motility-associated C-terminal domain-containing protein n=1 Tax=Flavobacterium psychroterrae TaxID=2133767 RepID=A0ABS5PAE6_9FLAO|nr:gliding motility-associated C-terminal domain-containing protein [Flavobacterium psychroterrae]MBS7231238.1 gliding motility-associated C-terminal domain-containing protein [Flavobacterium psychroterrae]